MASSMVSWDDVDSTDPREKGADKGAGVRRVAVVGAGLVGSLAASVLAQRGFDVEVFEYR